MRLIDLLDYVDSYITVKVFDLNDNLLTWYDGKNSIDGGYLGDDVFTISAQDGALCITLDY